MKKLLSVQHFLQMLLKEAQGQRLTRGGFQRSGDGKDCKSHIDLVEEGASGSCGSASLISPLLVGQQRINIEILKTKH
jgi:hypothetical protein